MTQFKINSLPQILSQIVDFAWDDVFGFADAMMKARGEA